MANKHKPEEFLGETGKKLVTDAVRKAEKETSGEIVVHLESDCADAYKRAVEVFEKIGMTKTEKRNGVLIYMAVNARKFAIIGDTGINEKVPKDFWDATSAKMGALFAGGKFAEGLEAGVLDAGARLREFFPYQPGQDKNELSDSIST